MTAKHVEAFEASLTRCLESPAFVPAFYERFLGSSDWIRGKFRDTDFARQHRALADSLYVMALAVQDASPDNLGRRELKRLAQRHHAMQVDAAMYDTWLDCLLQAARAHDPHFSETVEQAWRATLVPGIEFMRTGKAFD